MTVLIFFEILKNVFLFSQDQFNHRYMTLLHSLNFITTNKLVRGPRKYQMITHQLSVECDEALAFSVIFTAFGVPGGEVSFSKFIKVRLILISLRFANLVQS